MHKLLIADVSEGYANALASVLQNEFEVQLCHDGDSALELLLSFRPEVLVINLMLPYKDGLTVLQESAHKPRVILAITPYVNAYVEQVSVNVGVQYIMIMPTVNALRVRLMDMVASTLSATEAPPVQAVVHLHILNFATHLDGYHQLCAGIPIFAQNPGMRLSKELYPAIAAHFGLSDARTVEHSIRKSISAAWVQRDPAVWEKYFPKATSAPSNKAFISRIAEMLETQK